MMPVEKLRGEDELASDRNDMKFSLLSMVAFKPARTCSDTSDDFLPEEQSVVTCLPPWWEVRTKVSCDAITSVGASKPMLEGSFDARADIFISSDWRARATLIGEQVLSEPRNSPSSPV